MTNESLSFSFDPDGTTQEVRIPVKNGEPKGIGQIIDQQISLSGREIDIHCPSIPKPYKVDPYCLEEAREFSAVRRERFVSGFMQRLKENRATSIVIRNSKE